MIEWRNIGKRPYKNACIILTFQYGDKDKLT